MFDCYQSSTVRADLCEELTHVDVNLWTEWRRATAFYRRHLQPPRVSLTVTFSFTAIRRLHQLQIPPTIASHIFLEGKRQEKTNFWGSCLRYDAYRKMIAAKTAFVRFFFAEAAKHKLGGGSCPKAPPGYVLADTPTSLPSRFVVIVNIVIIMISPSNGKSKYKTNKKWFRRLHIRVNFRMAKLVDRYIDILQA